MLQRLAGWLCRGMWLTVGEGGGGGVEVLGGEDSDMLPEANSF